MSQIVLDDNLKYLISGLSLEHRGELFTSLLENNLTTSNSEIASVYQYIMSLQKDIEAKKQHMREIGAKGGRAKKKQTTTSLSDANLSSSTATLSLSTAKNKRKEAKENNIYNKKIKPFISDILVSANNVDNNDDYSTNIFTPPSLLEVKSFIKKENLNISAETFLDFYKARDWHMGKIKISDWQAVARMWHRRQKESFNQQKTGFNQISSPDEQYWQELKERVSATTTQDEEYAKLPPFQRFIKRVEYETNIIKETENDRQN